MCSRSSAAFGVLILSVLVVGCGDDANDGALRDAQAAARAAELAAEFRATQTTAPAGTAEPSAEPTGVVVPVIALDNSFRPQSIEIRVGDEVVWENRGANEHDVLSIVSDSWGVEVEAFQPGDVYAHVFTEPGEYAYYCSIHGNEEVGMVGTIVVNA